MRDLPRRALLVGWALAGAGPAADGQLPKHPLDLISPPSAIRLPTFDGRRFELPSGPTVYLAEDHSLPLVEIALALRVGSFLDPPDRAGLAYLTGSQLRRAGGAGLGAAAFDARVDELGARLDSTSGLTRSGARLSVPSWALDEALDLFVGMLARPGFQPDRLRTARGHLVETMKGRNENALQVLEREWAWLMVGEQHFSTRPMTPATLDAIETADLVRFHRHYWHPGAMILAVSGDFEPRQLLDRLESRFVGWPERGEGFPVAPWPPPAPRPSGTPGLFHYQVEVPQAKVLLGHRVPVRLDWKHPDRFALEVLAEILGGGGAISRVAGRLRTAEGLVYRASAQLDVGDLWPGELRIFFESEARSVAPAVRFTLHEIERLRQQPVHSKELEVAVRTLKSRLRLAFDTAEELAGYLAEDELIQRPHAYWQDYLDSIGAVSAEDVRRAAQTYLQPDRFTYLVVGRWQEIASHDSTPGGSLEGIVGRPVVRLPARDPLSLEPLATQRRPEPSSGSDRLQPQPPSFDAGASPWQDTGRVPVLRGAHSGRRQQT